MSKRGNYAPAFKARVALATLSASHAPDGTDVDVPEAQNQYLSKVKQLLRGMEMRTYDAMEHGIARALNVNCANDVHGMGTAADMNYFKS